MAGGKAIWGIRIDSDLWNYQGDDNRGLHGAEQTRQRVRDPDIAHGLPRWGPLSITA
jgi:hypothetical protein